MTRDELKSLGMTDRALATEYEGYFDVRPVLAGEDTSKVQERRKMAFDAAMTRRHGHCVVVNSTPLGPFGRDDPRSTPTAGTTTR